MVIDNILDVLKILKIKKKYPVIQCLFLNKQKINVALVVII